MALTINTNVASLTGQRYLSQSQNDLNTCMERLSSGLRINSAKDDAAGLAISDRMTSQIEGLDQAARNANDGISLAQTAEGALDEATEMLQRIRELAIQSANDTNSAADRASLQSEVNQLIQELDRIAESTSFNGEILLDGTMDSATFQIGANAGETITFSILSAETNALGVYSLDSNNDDATASIQAATAATDSTTNDTDGNQVEAQTLSITGLYGSDDIDILENDSAATIADKVNASTDYTGIKASAETYATLTNLSLDGNVSLNLQGSNDEAVTVTASVTTDDLTNLVTAINDSSGATGVTASLSSDKLSITLYQSDGEDIVINDFTHSASGAIDLNGDEDGSSSNVETLDGSSGSTTNSSTVGGTVSFTSDGSYTITSDIDNTAGSLFNTAADTINGSTLDSVDQVDISTVDGATDAINIVDGAISQIDALRGDLGAVQNRFESTITNLENVSENLTAARSRILDTDIAQETSEMTKNNILQQAGVSILTQANQTPELALQLLQG